MSDASYNPTSKTYIDGTKKKDNIDTNEVQSDIIQSQEEEKPIESLNKSLKTEHPLLSDSNSNIKTTAMKYCWSCGIKLTND